MCSGTEAQPAGGQVLGAAAVTKSRFRLASVTAAVLGALALVLIAAWALLTFLTRDIQISRDGAAMAAGLACGLVGMLVARRQPRNPEGWLLLGVAVGVFFVVDSGLYAVLDYRLHDGGLPLGEVALIGKGSIGTPLIFCFALIILLGPVWAMRKTELFTFNSVCGALWMTWVVYLGGLVWWALRWQRAHGRAVRLRLIRSAT